MPPSMDSTYGAILLALVITGVLYGVTLLQTHLYWRKYPDDTTLIKSLVILLLVVDTLHVALCTTAIYTYLITDYTDPAALGRSTWSMALQVDCNGLIALIVQCYFARRVWILSRNRVLVIVIVCLSIVCFALGIWFTVEEFVLVDVSKFGTLVWETALGLGSAAAADIIIAVSLCYYLLKSRTGFSRTDSIIFKLIGYSITTGMLTSIIALLSVITFAAMPENYVWLAFFWVIGKFYVNSFLAALNSRDSLRGNLEPPTSHHLKSLSAMESGRITKAARRASDASRDTIMIGKADSWDLNATPDPQHQQALSVSVETQTLRTLT